MTPKVFLSLVKKSIKKIPENHQVHYQLFLQDENTFKTISGVGVNFICDDENPEVKGYSIYFSTTPHVAEAEEPK